MHNLNLAFYMMVGWLELHWVPAVIVLGLVVALFAMLMLSGKRLWCGKAFRAGLGIAVAAWAAFILILPSMTRSSLGQVTYSTDWIMLALMSAGFAAVAFVLAYPTLALMGKKA
ncbi:MAG TPA: hypothetical protein ENO16_00050 [Chromatiales bacterium]|nr:hypothetical protein [Chromatiales bacterium]